MEWQQVLGFYHVARLKSFTAAAEATFRTQSALSQQIKSLEREFGCALFERAGRGNLVLTPEGERFQAFAEKALTGLESFREEIDELKKGRKGNLRFAAPFTTLYHLFPEFVRNYVEKFPGVELTLLDRQQESVIELVREGAVDFGFALEQAVPKGLTAIAWKEVETVLLVPEAHPLCSLKRVGLRHIARYPLIFPPKHLMHSGRAALEEKLRRRGLGYRIAMESSNIELTSVYVEMGIGVSLGKIVRDLPALKHRKLEFLPLGHLFGPERIALIMRKEKPLVSYKRAFVDMLFGRSE